MVKADGSWSRGQVMSLNHVIVYWMDVSNNASYYIKENMNQMGHTKKIKKQVIVIGLWFYLV